MNGPRRVVLVELNEDGSVGGSHRSLTWLVTNLDREKFEPIVVFYQDNQVADELRAKGIQVEAWDDHRRWERRLRRGIVGILLAWPALVWARWRFIRARRPAIVHVNNSPFMGYDTWLVACRLAGIPCVAHARGPRQSRPGLGRRLLAHRFDRVIAVSRHVAESWAQFGIPRHRLEVVSNGIDLDEFRARLRRPPAEVRAELGVPVGGFLVLLPGTLLSWKGQDVALEALALLPADLRASTVLAFAGGRSGSEDGAYHRRLEAIAAQAGLAESVRFLGARGDVPDLMRAADVVLHASTRPEAFGLVLLEAMALGRPLIASSLGGPAEVVTPEAGRLFDPTRPADLARELGTLLEDPGLRERLGRGGLALVESYPVTATARSVERVYGELLDGAPTGLLLALIGG